MDGILEGSNRPKIKIEFFGLLGREATALEFDAIIDTGFSGAVSIPITKALPLGLMLFSTASFTLADGRKENTFLCKGSARLEEQEKEVVFSLTEGNEILLGTEFLATFKAKLILDYTQSRFSLTSHL